MQKQPPVFVQARLCMRVLISTSSQMPDFHKTWCGNCTIGEHSNAVFTNFVHLVITAWRMNELVRWDRHWRPLLYSPEIIYGKVYSASKVWICSRSLAGTAGSNPSGGVVVCVLCVWCVVR